MPLPTRQHELRLSSGRLIRLDFAWVPHRVTLESEGRRWHATRGDFERDIARTNELQADGWQVLRAGWTDVHHRPGQIEALLRQVLGRA